MSPRPKRSSAQSEVRTASKPACSTCRCHARAVSRSLEVAHDLPAVEARVVDVQLGFRRLRGAGTASYARVAARRNSSLKSSSSVAPEARSSTVPAANPQARSKNCSVRSAGRVTQAPGPVPAPHSTSRERCQAARSSGRPRRRARRLRPAARILEHLELLLLAGVEMRRGRDLLRVLPDDSTSSSSPPVSPVVRLKVSV